jgi:hypothetical protein
MNLHATIRESKHTEKIEMDTIKKVPEATPSTTPAELIDQYSTSSTPNLKPLILDVESTKSQESLTEFRSNVHECASEMQCRSVPDHAPFLKAVSTQFGEVLVMNKRNQIELMAQPNFLLDNYPCNNFFYVKEWSDDHKKTLTQKTNKNENVIVGGFQELLRHITGNHQNSTKYDSNINKNLTLMQSPTKFETNNEDKFFKPCQCMAMMMTQEIPDRWCRSSLQPRNESSNVNVSNTRSRLKKVDTESFCFKHEMIVSWNNLEVSFHNLINDTQTKITLSDTEIMFVVLDSFPFLYLFDSKRHAFVRYNINTNEFDPGLKVTFERIQPNFLKYNPESSTAVFYTMNSFAVRTGENQIIEHDKIGDNFQVRSDCKELYYSVDSSLYRIDPLTITSTLIATFNHFIYEMFLSDDDEYLYLTLEEPSAFAQKTDYSICKLHIESGELMFRVKTEDMCPQNIFVNSDHSILMFNNVVDKNDATKNRRIALQLSPHTVTFYGVLNNNIAGVSSTRKSLYLKLDNMLYAKNISNDANKVPFPIKIDPYSTVKTLNSKIFVTKFNERGDLGYWNIYNYAEQMQKQEPTNVTEKIRIMFNKLPIPTIPENKTESDSLNKPIKKNSGMSKSSFLQSSINLNITIFDYNSRIDRYLAYEDGGNFLFLLDQDFNCSLEDIFNSVQNNLIAGAFVADGKSFVVHNQFGMLEMWNTASCLRVKILAKSVMAFTYSDKLGLLFYISIDGNLVFYDLDSFEVVHTMRLPISQISSDKWRHLILDIDEDIDKLYIVYHSSLFSVDLVPKLTYLEKEYLMHFFPKDTRLINEEDFAYNLSNFAHVYAQSLFLKTYMNIYFVAGCYYLNRNVAKLPSQMVLSQMITRMSSSQLSAIKLAAITKNLSLLDIICERYIKFEPNTILSQSELKILLEAEMKNAKLLLMSRFKELDHRKLYSMINPQNSYKSAIVSQEYPAFSEYALDHHFKKENSQTKRSIFSSWLFNLLKKESVVSDNETKLYSNIQGHTRVPAQLKQANKITNKEFYLILIKCNFLKGSQDSLDFLHHYSESKFDEFVLSDWMALLFVKWNESRHLYWIHSAVLVLGTIFLTASVYFHKEPIIVFPCLGVLLLLLMFEFMSMFIYKKRYWKQYENFLDLGYLISGIILVAIWYRMDVWYQAKDVPVPEKVSCGSFANFRCPPDEKHEMKAAANLTGIHFALMVCLIAAYIRTLLAMKVFPFFRHLIAMLWAIVVNVIDIIALYIIIILMFANLLKISSSKSFVRCIEVMFQAIQGDNQYADDSTMKNESALLYVLTGILFTLVMANFMIARISNTYSELEQSQMAVNYREMARILWQIEIFSKFFNSSPTNNFEHDSAVSVVEEKIDGYQMVSFPLEKTDRASEDVPTGQDSEQVVAKIHENQTGSARRKSTKSNYTSVARPIVSDTTKMELKKRSTSRSWGQEYMSIRQL